MAQSSQRRDQRHFHQSQEDESGHSPQKGVHGGQQEECLGSQVQRLSIERDLLILSAQASNMKIAAQADEIKNLSARLAELEDMSSIHEEASVPSRKPRYHNCIRPDFSTHINHLASLDVKRQYVLDDSERRELLREEVAVSYDLCEAVYVDLVTGNIKNLYASVGPSHPKWCEVLFGERRLFEIFLEFERQLFKDLGLNQDAIQRLLETLEKTRQLAEFNIDQLGSDAFSSSFNEIREFLKVLKERDLTRVTQRVAARKVFQVFCLTATVLDAVGPVFFPFLSTEQYAASVTLGGAGLTATSLRL